MLDYEAIKVRDGTTNRVSGIWGDIKKINKE